MKPLATPNLTRSPVNAPGPVAIAMAASLALVSARSRRWWISERSVVVCERSAGKDRVESVRPS